MDKFEIEKIVGKIYALRIKKGSLAKEIREQVGKLLAHMNNVNKRTLKTSDYSVEKLTRIKRNLDFDGLDQLIAKGVVPEKYVRKEEYERLIISTHKDIELINGKWVRK